MLQLLDLINTFSSGTVLQKTRRLKELLGVDVEIQSTIGDIEDNSIRLDFVLSDVSTDVDEWDIDVRFDRDRFAEQLLSYSYGDDVVLTATLKSRRRQFAVTRIHIRSAVDTKDRHDV